VNSPEVFNEGYLNEAHPEWGAGPYEMTEFDPKGGTVIFEPNPKWWGDKPLLDTVTFRQLDDTAEINAFKAGEINMALTNTADRLAQVADMDDVVTYKAQRTSTNLMQLNAERPQLADIKVREAIMKAVDREQIKEVVWNGLDYEEDPIGSLMLFPFQDGYVDSLSEAGWKFSDDDANALLDEAGWVAGSDGIREKDGVKLAVTLPVFGDDPIVETRGKVIQAQLKAIGVDVTVDVRPSSEFSTTISTKDWDIVLMGFSSSDPYGFAYFCQVYCSDSGLNLSATGTPELDEKIQSVADLPTAEEQIAEGTKVETELMEATWGILPLYSGPEIRTVTKGLANLTPETYTGLDLFGLLPVENVGWEK